MENVIEKDQIAVDVKENIKKGKPENNQMVKAASAKKNGKEVKNKGDNKDVELNNPKVEPKTVENKSVSNVETDKVETKEVVDGKVVSPELNKQALVVQPIVVQKETTIIINSLRRGNLFENLTQIIGNDCFNDLVNMVKAKEQDITVLDYDKLIQTFNYITIESMFDEVTHEKINTLVELPKTRELASCLEWYRKAFPEGFVIVSEEVIDDELVSLMFEVDSLKMTYVWQSLIDEIADFAGVEKNYGFGLLMSEDKNFKCEYRNGFFLYNPVPYYEMEWDECLVDMLLNATELFTHHMGYHMHCDFFKTKFVKILQAMLVKRLDTRDIYNKTKRVSRKHGVKI